MTTATWQPGLTVETVEELYARRDSMAAALRNRADNPYDGRCAIIPRKATYYVMVPESEKDRIAQARLMMKSLARRRKVREARAERDDVNFHGYAPCDNVIIFYA